MKKVKYILNNDTLYDYHRIQKKLTRMAAQGWHLEKISGILWKFRRGEPKAVLYDIIYSAEASVYNSRPTEAEEDLADLCAGAGWERVASVAQMQIYRSEDPSATPLETDELQKFKNLSRNMRRHFFPQQLWTILLFAVQFLMFGSSALRKPASILSSPMMLFILAATAGTAILHTANLIHDLLWLGKAGLAVDAGHPIPPNRFCSKFQWITWGFITVELFCLAMLMSPSYALTMLLLTGVMIAASMVTITVTKWLNAPKWVNIWIPTLVAAAVLLSSQSFFSDHLFPEKSSPELPLTLSQLTGETETDQLTIEVDSSLLVSHGRYYDFGAENQIQYTLVDIHCPLVYDLILNDLELDYIKFRCYQGDAILSDALRETIGAEYLRRSTGQGQDDWFICWEDRILMLYADWELTDAQIMLLCDLLRP